MSDDTQTRALNLNIVFLFKKVVFCVFLDFEECFNILIKRKMTVSIAMRQNNFAFGFFRSLMFVFLFVYFTAISREEGEESHNNHRGGHNHGNKVPYNGYTSEEFLDRLEPNGNNIQSDKTSFGKRKCFIIFYFFCVCLWFLIFFEMCWMSNLDWNIF